MGCRILLGRRKDDKWKPIRLTKDHLARDPEEALRIAAAGGVVKRLKHVNGEGATDHTGLGLPRLYSRLFDGLPGLAVSRGLGDALGKSSGFSAEAQRLEADLGAEDLLLVAAS